MAINAPLNQRTTALFIAFGPRITAVSAALALCTAAVRAPWTRRAAAARADTGWRNPPATHRSPLRKRAHGKRMAVTMSAVACVARPADRSEPVLA
jgi:hypothetical protein